MTALIAWANFCREAEERSTIRWQRRLKRERPTCTERTKLLLESADGRMASVANSAGEKLVNQNNTRTHLTPTGLLMEGDYTF